ncbi:MAG: DUF3857 and transglutaminase domain-containing protein [Candidatus Zixiibacteriota bacterium]
MATKIMLRRQAISVIALFAAMLILSLSVQASTVPDETMKLINKAGGLEEYPDADALIILSKADIEFNEDGTGLTWVYELRKILTEAGIDRYGEEHLFYYKVYDDVRVATARVIKQDGSVVDVAEDEIKDISAAPLEFMNIYDSDARDKVIAFKDLEVGDCIEVHYLDSLFHAPMEGQFDGGDIFQQTVPILKKVTTVIGPASKPLKYIVKNGEVDFKKTEKGDKIEYVWSVENMPKIVTEPAMPSFTEIAPTLIFTTIDSWEYISRWWNDIAESKLAMNDALRAEVAVLTADATTRDERVDAIYHFVAQKVRYMGLGTGKKKGFEPKPVVETYETKYGVCRDVAALMVAMLREADVDCDIVLTSMGSEVFYDLPYIGFNHAIVAIRNDDGTYTYADPTVENSVDWLPSLEAEQQVLRCNATGSGLADTPYSPPEENMGTIQATSKLSESGLFTSDVTFVMDGFYDMAMRGFLKRIPSAQLQMIFGYLIQDIYPGTMLTNFSTSDPEDLTTPLQLNFSYQIPDYRLEANEFMLVKAPISLGVFELISRSVFSSASLPERKYPWNLGFTFGATEEETISLPAGYKLKAVPDAVVKDFGPIEYRMTYTSDLPADLDQGGTQVTYRKQLLLKSKKMSPEEYKKLKEVLQARSKSSRGDIIMVKENEG